MRVATEGCMYVCGGGTEVQPRTRLGQGLGCAWILTILAYVLLFRSVVESCGGCPFEVSQAYVAPAVLRRTWQPQGHET